MGSDGHRRRQRLYRHWDVSDAARDAVPQRRATARTARNIGDDDTDETFIIEQVGGSGDRRDDQGHRVRPQQHLRARQQDRRRLRRRQRQRHRQGRACWCRSTSTAARTTTSSPTPAAATATRRSEQHCASSARRRAGNDYISASATPSSTAAATTTSSSTPAPARGPLNGGAGNDNLFGSSTRRPALAAATATTSYRAGRPTHGGAGDDILIVSVDGHRGHPDHQRRATAPTARARPSERPRHSSTSRGADRRPTTR